MGGCGCTTSGSGDKLKKQQIPRPAGSDQIGGLNRVLVNYL